MHLLLDRRGIVPERALLTPPLRDAGKATPARREVRRVEPQVLEVDGAIGLHEFADPPALHVFPFSGAHDDEDLHGCLHIDLFAPAYRKSSGRAKGLPICGGGFRSVPTSGSSGGAPCWADFHDGSPGPDGKRVLPVREEWPSMTGRCRHSGGPFIAACYCTKPGSDVPQHPLALLEAGHVVLRDGMRVLA